MNTYKSVIFVLVSMLFFVISCRPLKEDENHHFKIRIKNNWNYPIAVWHFVDWRWNSNPFDKNFKLFYDKPIDEGCPKIQPGCIDDELMTSRDYYERLEINDTVVIGLFDAQDPYKNDSECFLVRYYMSKEDLKKIKFCVCYPPTEDMKDFYMYPSYEEVIRKSEETDSEDNIQNQ